LGTRWLERLGVDLSLEAVEVRGGLNVVMRTRRSILHQQVSSLTWRSELRPQSFGAFSSPSLSGRLELLLSRRGFHP
jgi:hypothetical protein